MLAYKYCECTWSHVGVHGKLFVYMYVRVHVHVRKCTQFHVDVHVSMCVCIHVWFCVSKVPIYSCTGHKIDYIVHKY